MPLAAQATPDTWNGNTNTAWATATNWSTGAAPINTSAVTVPLVTNEPIITTAVSLNATSGSNIGSLTMSSGASLTINSGGSLTMGTHTLTLNGGSITNSGPLGSAGGILVNSGGSLSYNGVTGYGTVSLANAAAGTWNANGAAGNALTLTGGSTYVGTFTTAAGQGGFNFGTGTGAGQGVTMNGVTFSGTGAYNLNGATINGLTFTNTSQVNVTGNSTLTGTIAFNQYATINLGGTNPAATLNLGSGATSATLNTVTGGAAPFIIGTGGALNYASTANGSMGGGGTVTMQGGSITNTGGGLFTVGDPISGYGTVSGNVAIAAGNLTAGVTGSAHTLFLNGVVLGTTGSGPGIGTAGGGTLDLQGNISVPSSANMNPGTGSILFDGTTISGPTGSSHNINNSGLPTSGTFTVTNASTFSNVNFSTGNGANLQINAPLTAQGGATVNATNVTMSGTGALNLLNTTGTTPALTTKNLTMAQGSTLNGGAHDSISLTGNFSFQQTNPSNWTYDTTAGLGPDLTMSGGTSTSPTTLEVGGINGAGFINNFALNSLTLSTTSYVGLVDQYANATPSGWTSGSEALYLDNLFGTSKTSYGTLNLDGLSAYLLGYGPLQNGIFTDANGNLVDIVGAPVPEPSALSMIGLGGVALLGIILRKRRWC